MKRATRLLFSALVLMIPGTISAQMHPGTNTSTGGMSGMPVSAGTLVGGISSVVGMPISGMMGTGGALAIGDDGTAYLLLDADYSDLSVVKTPIASVPLTGQGWKVKVNGLGTAIAAGTNGIVVATSAVAISPMPLLPSTGAAVFPVPAVSKTALNFLKLSGAVLRDPVSLEGSLVALTIQKAGTAENVYALTRVTTVVAYDPTTNKSPFVSKLKLTVISLSGNSSRTVDLSSDPPEEQ